jgi:hypothetical protein
MSAMSEASFASLEPALLARKGGAKPAMRPQLAPLPQDPAGVAAIAEDKLEDLGWNDMGQDDEPEIGPVAAPETAQVVSIAPMAANEDVTDFVSPIITRERKKSSSPLLANAASDYVEEDEPVEDDGDDSCAALVARTSQAHKPRVKQQAIARTSTDHSGRRAAFTLRLDPARHLKLRLAATMQGVSAQALVTAALDEMFDQFEELDALAQRMSRN